MNFEVKSNSFFIFKEFALAKTMIDSIKKKQEEKKKVIFKINSIKQCK